MKNVLIIGASRGIGLEFVRQYRDGGAEVMATARSADGLARLRALGATALPLDVTEAASVAAWAALLGALRFDAVVLNAGVYGPHSAALSPPSAEDFNAVMHTNVLGAMQVLPRLVGHLAPGARLAVISSRMGSIGLRTSASGWLYRASKAALNSVLKDVSLTLAGQAVCVAFHPGWVRTDMGGSGADLDVADSVATMRATLAGLTAAANGGFFNHDGQTLAW
jgi:NAD(P)-dependent dehydrogenase (short-subunit alcohol dehydrogenase family)